MQLLTLKQCNYFLFAFSTSLNKHTMQVQQNGNVQPHINTFIVCPSTVHSTVCPSFYLQGFADHDFASIQIVYNLFL